jgi:5-methylcytosine-specific restriction endonuclease McrA
MKHLEKPTFGLGDVLGKYLRRRPKGKHDAAIRHDNYLLIEAEERYKLVCASRSLHLSKWGEAAFQLSADDMENLYKSVRESKMTGPLYNSMIGPPRPLCPHCKHRDATTLDHQLPKADRHIFALTPINLVPCCMDCNHTAGSKRDFHNQRMLHPYYDYIDSEQWLQLDFIDPSAIVTMRFEPIQYWSADLNKAIERHFEMFDLKAQFTSWANSELVSFVRSMRKSGLIDRPDAIQDQAAIVLSGADKGMRNSWKSVLYKGIVDSRWFRTIGIKNLTVP